MRCPKCGFMSFDIIENCVKCGKSISDAAVDLAGTVAGVAPPSFLRIPGEESAAAEEVHDETAEMDMDEPLDLGIGGEEEVMDFSFDDEPSTEAEATTGEIELDLGGEETAELDLGEEKAEVEESPEIDLSLDEPVAAEEAIGISDLAPDEDDEEVVLDEPVEEEFEEAFEGAGEDVVESGAGAGLGLEDLKVDGIDLESTPGTVDSDSITPSVKTGTALDDFDVDLGDLLTGKED